MRIRTQLNLSMLLFTLVVIAITITLIIAEGNINQIRQQRNVVQRIESDVRDLSYLANDYLLHPAETQLLRWQVVYREVGENIDTLEVFTTEEAAYLLGMKESYPILGEIFASVSAALASGTIEASAEDYLDLVRTSWSRIEIQNRSLVSSTAALGRLLQEDETAAINRRDVSIFIMLAVLIVFLAMVYFFSFRRMLGSLRNLNTGTEVVGSGDLDYRIPVTTKDEVADLSMAFNRMTGNLHDVTVSKERLEREIAERKIAEQALRESEEKFSSVFRQLPDAITVVDVETGVILDVNDSASKMSGYERSEVVGHTIDEVNLWVHDEERSRIIAALRERGEVSGEEFKFRRKNGEVITVSFSAHRMVLNGRLCEVSVQADITARKRAEEALRESEERFRIMADSSPQPIWVTGKQGELQFANRTYCEFFGASEEELKSHGWEPTVHPDDAERHVRAFFASVASQSSLHSEARILRGDGEYRWLETFGVPRFAPDGEYLGMVGSSPDTTERKRAEEALQESERRWATTLASVGDAVIATDARGNIDFMNGIAEYLTGWGLKTAKGRSIIEVFNIINETTGETVESPVEHVLREGAIVGLANHTVLVRRDGTQIPIDDSGAPIRNEDGIINGVVLVFRDVTKRKEQEQALRKSEEAFRTVFEHSSVGKILTNYDGKILRLNQAMADMLGYTIEELKKKTLLDVTHPDDMNASVERLDALLNNEAATMRLEKRYIKKDGSVFWGDVSTTLLRDERGKPDRFITNVVDINERKKIDQMKDEFIGMVSHEIKTPLTVVIGALSTATKNGLPPEDVRGFLQDAVSYADILTDIVDNLLELSRSQSNRLVLNKEPADIRPIALKVAKNLENKSARHHIIVDMPEGLPHPVIDPLRAERIIHNLVDNAIKYSPEGGDVTVFARAENSHLLVGVQDQGIGIAPEDQQRLFQRFQRLEYNTGTSIQGIGLGLNVCRILVEAHGGSIWVESEKGKGATFYFALPLEQEARTY